MKGQLSKDDDERPRLAYHAVRPGTPAVFYVHGIGEGHFVWRPIVERVDPRLGAVTMDLRGHGDSEWDARKRYMSEDYADDIASVVHACGSRDYILVGHSLGAAASLTLALRKPRGLRGLVLIDFGSPHQGSGHGEIAREAEARHKPYASAEAFLREFAPTRPLIKPELLALYPDHVLRRDEEGHFVLKNDPAVFAARRSGDLLSSLPAVSCPTMIVRGAYSSVLSKAQALSLSKLRCVTHYREIPRSGHAIMTENPSDLVDALNAFFEDLQPGGGADQ